MVSALHRDKARPQAETASRLILVGLGSLAMTFVGLSGYWRSSRLIKMLETGTVEAKELTV